MKVLMLDTSRVEEIDEFEAARRICARVAVEAPMETKQNPAPESAMLDRSSTTMTKPRPQPRPAPAGSPKPEKRGKRRTQ